MTYERQHSKDEILTAYLNTVYFGAGAYGAQTAAKTYFGKSAKNLSFSQAATLAGFLHAPSTYVTWDGDAIVPQARERRDRVLELMQNQGMISAEEREKAEAAPLKFAPTRRRRTPRTRPSLKRSGATWKRTWVRGRCSGGLSIRTTLDPDLQRAVVQTSQDVLPYPNDPSAAVVTVEPQTGTIRALAGRKGEFNLALDARRQPGSSFKPIVLAAALRDGISPQSTYIIARVELPFPGRVLRDSQLRLYRAGEDLGRRRDGGVGQHCLRPARRRRGPERRGPDGQRPRHHGPRRPLPIDGDRRPGHGREPPGHGLGLRDLRGRGHHRGPFSIESIERNSYGHSETVYDHEIRGERVLSGNDAAVETQVLRGSVQDGTATMFHDLDEEIGHLSAGKTGTTDRLADAWYVGYTPRLCTSVWVAYPEGRKSLVGVHGEQEPNGEVFPMDIFSEYMAQATQGDLALDFPEGDESDLDVIRGDYSSGF